MSCRWRVGLKVVGATFAVAFGAVSPAVDVHAESLEAAMGRALFQRSWVAAPSSTRAVDGLGPLFSARSCVACHPAAGRGVPPRADGTGPGFAVRLNNDPVYGQQFQDNAVPGLAAEGQLAVEMRQVPVRYPDNTVVILQRQAVQATNLGYGPLAAGTALSVRVAPALAGDGLLERVAEADVLAFADPQDRNGDGVRGRPSRLSDGRLGRFGWKASQPDVSAQDAAAFFLDIGMSTPLQREPWGDCTAAQSVCRNAPHGDSPEFEGLEIPSASLALVDTFVRSLPPPRDTAPEASGLALFTATGCAACHRPSLPVGDATPSGTIHAFTDLLLHDMGGGLADGVGDAVAGGGDWRTAPLWGMAAQVGQPNRPAALLHDGRARTVEEAILWHGGEAESARGRFMSLPYVERQRLLRFIEAL